jgi:23S rRNA (uracil1939-C5)-methyltransferase/tRNA (uracil-5-)-methyltransferase
VVKSKKNLAEADLVKLLEISPRRVAPKCPVFGECGGCAYQHADYELQLELKTAQVSDLLRRVGGFQNASVSPMLPSPEQWGYPKPPARFISSKAIWILPSEVASPR